MSHAIPLEQTALEHFSDSHQSRLPVFIQTETAECGLACIGMIASFYGYESDLNSLRRQYPVSSRGLNFKLLIGIATELKLSPRALRLEIDDAEHLQLPCVLHWELNHFVVLKEIRSNKYLIHDPALGAITVDQNVFSRKFTGVALELSPTTEFVKQKRTQKLKITSLWTHSKGLLVNISQVIIASLLIQLFAIATPFYMQTVIDDVLINSNNELLVALAAGFSLLLIVDITTRAFRDIVILHVSSRLNIQMAANLFRHLIKLPMDYFQKRHVGDLVSRFSSLDQVREVLTTGVAVAIVDGVMAAITLIAMFIYSPMLAAIVLFVVAVYALIRVIIFKPMRALTSERILADAKQETHFMETVRAVQTIKIFQMQNDRQIQWVNLLGSVINKDIALAKWVIGHQTINRILFGFLNIVIVYVAAKSIGIGTFTIGMLFAFTSYKDRFAGSIDALVETIFSMKMLNLHLDRISDIAFASVDVSRLNNQSSSHLVQRKKLNGRVKVQDLEYTYNRLEAPVFTDVNFTVEAGQTLAIVGESGCGKTTLMKNMMGLLQPSQGTVLIDDVPVNEHDNYFSNIAGVMQDDRLFAGSIAENIACFASNADMKRIAICAHLASIHNDIMKMPMQYNTLVGDMGSALSGGQQQRVILARAYYHQPRILFLDEATSHLDVPTERKVNLFVKKLNITRIIVAHRPQTIETADIVFNLSTKTIVTS